MIENLRRNCIGKEHENPGRCGKMTLKEEFVETDVLCIGGGIAGLMAAIRARELGANVVVVEKGNALFSGRGRAGNDHFWCYIPEVHGTDIGVVHEGMPERAETEDHAVRYQHEGDAHVPGEVF